MERQIALEELAVTLDLHVDQIDINRGFVSQGGHSIAALQFVARCLEHHVSVPVDVVLRSNTVQEILLACKLDPTAPVLPPAAGVSAEQQQPHVNNDNNAERKEDSVSAAATAVQHKTDDLVAREVSSSSDDDSFDSSSGTPSSEDESSATVGTSPSPSLANYSVLPSKALSAGLKLVRSDVQKISSRSNQEASHVGEFTEMQLSLIHGSMHHPGTNVIHYYETHRSSAIPVLEAAWKKVVADEPIFRTTYCNPEDNSLKPPTLYWREFETTSRCRYDEFLSGVIPPWPLADSGSKSSTKNNSSLDLGIRFTTVTLRKRGGDGDVSALVWSVHHCLVDGWSAANLLEKVRQTAIGVATKPGRSFSDIVRGLHDYRQEHEAEGTAFWQSQQTRLATSKGSLELPPGSLFDMAANDMESESNNKKEEISLSLKRHWEAIETAARACGVTVAALVHAAWAMALSLYSDADHVYFGVVVSGRNLPLPGVLDTIGPLVNTLPLQLSLDRTLTARQLVGKAAEQLQQVSRFGWTTPDHGFARDFDTVLAIRPDLDMHNKSGTAATPLRSFTKQTTNIPISVLLEGRGLLTLQYTAQQYQHAHMRNLARCFRDAMLSLTRETDMPVETCMRGLVSTSSLALLRLFGNCASGLTTRVNVSDDLVTVFERTIAAHSSRVAVEGIDARRTVTYTELDRLSGRLARELLRGEHFRAGQIVPVHADGSLYWVVAIWAVLRAGGIYCPIDQANPKAARDDIFQACSARYFLATSCEAVKDTEAKHPTGSIVIDVPAVLEKALETTEEPFPRRKRARPAEVAYVCFTSGSTGKPKGVMCSHEGLVAHEQGLEARLMALPGRRIAQFMSPAFDGSINEVFSTLTYGGTLVLRNPDSPMEHLKKVESVMFTPSLASHLRPADYPMLKTVYLVGEAVPQLVCDTWASQKTLYNMYGPTETTCGATISRLYPGQPVTIGKPVSTMRIYILNQHQQLAPVACVGEIWLAGIQVSRGYIGQPELTKQRFFPDAICQGLGELMYRTGDRGYWNADGDIVYLGRSDRQVKMRGFRLDLDDVETRILRCCSEARAVAVTCKANKTELACMIETDGTSSTSVAQIRAKIAHHLPVQAVPRSIALVASLPVTATGKIDYKAVAAITATAIGIEPENNPGAAVQGVAQRRAITAAESKLADIWADVLDLDRDEAARQIHLDSSFVDLGGHSLRQLRLASRLTAAFNVPVTLRLIMRWPVLHDLAREIGLLQAAVVSSDDDAAVRSPTSTTAIDAKRQPSPAEVEWWQKYRCELGSGAFNVSFASTYDPAIIDTDRFVDAWNQVLARYDIFRSLYVYSRLRGRLERQLAVRPPAVQHVAAIDVCQEINRPFSLESEPPVRVVVSPCQIVATWSHIVCDYTTLGLVLADVAAVYKEGQGQKQEALVYPYHDAAAWSYVAPASSLAFWTAYLASPSAATAPAVPAPVRAAYLGNGGERQSYGGTSVVASVRPSLWHTMRTVLDGGRVTAQQLALAATTLALSAIDDTLDMTVGLPFLNRPAEADMQTVGLFLEPLPVHVAFASDNNNNVGSGDVIFPPTPTTATGYIDAVQSLAQQALAHAVPWDQLMRQLGIDSAAAIPNHPLFDCVVSFHDMRPSVSGGGGVWSKLDLGSDGLQPQMVWSEGSKFQLMVEFTALSDDLLLLRLEFDDACYDGPQHIAAVRRLILQSLQKLLVAPDTLSFAQLRDDVRQLWVAEGEAGYDLARTWETDAALLVKTDGFFQATINSL